MAGKQCIGESLPQSKVPMELAEPVQGKVLSKLPKHPSVANAGSSKAIQRIAPSVEIAKDDIPGASMEASGSGRNPNVMEPSKLTTAPAEAATTNSGPLIQEGMQPHGRGRSHRSFAPKLAQRDSSLIRANQGPRDGADKLIQQQTQRSWATIAKSAEKISDEILRNSDPKWKECLVGYFVGKKLPFKLTETAVKTIWGTQVVDVLANGDGFFFFHIPDDSFHRRIVDGGPITILRVPMILQQWHPAMRLEKNQHETLPVWVRLKNVPIALWSASGISVVASALGRPLHVDIQTERMRMISYARVCIEIKASQTMLESVEILLNGENWSVMVEYEWRPMACMKCGTFGHRCAPAIGSSTAVKKAPVPDVVAVNEPPPEGAQWETVRRKQSGEHSWILANSASPAKRSDSVNLKTGISTTQNLLPSGRSRTSASTADPALIVDLQVPIPDFGKDGHHIPTDLALSSSANSLGSSGSDASIDGSASEVGSDSEEELASPVSPSTRRKFSMNRGGIPEVSRWVPGMPIPSLDGPSSVHIQPLSGDPNKEDRNSLLRAPMMKDPTHISIYGDHTFVARRSLWEDLVSSSGLFETDPWLVAGDFNVIRFNSDRLGSSNVWIPAFDEFGICLDQSGLEDLRYIGHRFTWSTSSGDTRKQRKINRVLINDQWSSSFSFSEANFLAPGVSDHSQMLIRIAHAVPSRKPFKFFNFWMTHPSYSDIVSQVWNSQIFGSPMFVLCRKLRLLKGRLKQLNRNSYSDISTRVAQARLDLNSTQQAISSDPFNPRLAILEKERLQEFSLLRLQEEAFLKQKSRIR
ncbi:uncharacterized protein LOC115663828 [Syzygium oleosum]|uniref:uncharacterized protein LOC115663828 n=1 Tax=Syzygium oleosum TaxID=219896 RepID=UPI0024B8F0B2|nr:uncharacterized protein LOC115663828 [Syzygium oleosum]